MTSINMLTVYATQIDEKRISVTTTETEKSGNQVRTYQVGIEGINAFTIPNDLNMFTANLLYATAAKLMRDIDPSDQSFAQPAGTMTAMRTK